MIAPPTCAVLSSALAALAFASEPAPRADTDSELERRRRRLEKLRWQLRVARRAVAAKRRRWSDLGVESAPRGLNRALVWGLVAGGAVAVGIVQVVSQWVFQ